VWHGTYLVGTDWKGFVDAAVAATERAEGDLAAWRQQPPGATIQT
jgi:hypothetical protein